MSDVDGLVLGPEQAGGAAEVDAMVIEAFGNDKLRGMLRDLRGSDAWIDGLSFVAHLDGELVGHVLFTRSLLDAPRRLVDVLVLSPSLCVPTCVIGASGRPWCAMASPRCAIVPNRWSSWRGRRATTRGSASCPAAGSASVAAGARACVPGHHPAVVRDVDDRHPGVRRRVLAT